MKENNFEKEKVIRAIVSSYVESYASGFSDRHICEKDDDEGTINMKINNVFIAALGPEIQFYSALSRSLDSSLGNMLEKMAIKIAKLNYEVSDFVEGDIYESQVSYIARLLESYKRNEHKPQVSDYKDITTLNKSGVINKRHESDYYIYDNETGYRYLIELKIGGDLDNKKARSEKEALLEQYCILSNQYGEDKIKLLFATAYNRYGEGNVWKQERVRQFFAEEELCISSSFWNFVSKSDRGYDIVIDEYRKTAKSVNLASCFR